MRQSPEHGEQVAYFTWVRQHEDRFPQLQFIHAVPMGRFRSWLDANWLKAEGARAGPLDVQYDGGCPAPAECSWAGFRFEFKPPQKATDVSYFQQEWIKHLHKEGFFVAVVDMWQEAVNLTIEYFRLPLRQQPIPRHIHEYLGGKRDSIEFTEDHLAQFDAMVRDGLHITLPKPKPRRRKRRGPRVRG